MKKTILIVFTLLLSGISFAQEVNWLSFEEAMKLNDESPRQILIDVYTDWCGWCKKMDKDTYSNAVIATYINTHFYAVKLNGEHKKDIKFNNHTFKFKKEKNTKYHELAAALMDGKLSYPTTLFMDENKVLLNRIPGYISTVEMEKVLAYFNEKKYKTEKWGKFLKTFKSKL